MGPRLCLLQGSGRCFVRDVGCHHEPQSGYHHFGSWSLHGAAGEFTAFPLPAACLNCYCILCPIKINLASSGHLGFVLVHVVVALCRLICNYFGNPLLAPAGIIEAVRAGCESVDSFTILESSRLFTLLLFNFIQAEILQSIRLGSTRRYM